MKMSTNGSKRTGDLDNQSGETRSEYEVEHVQPFEESEVQEDDFDPEQQGIEHTDTRASNAPLKKSFFGPSFAHDRIWLYKTIGFTWLLIAVGLFIILPIYWGSFYKREERIFHLKISVYNMDELDDGTPGAVGQALVDSFPTGKDNPTFTVHTDASTLDEVKETVHHEDNWGAVFVSKNTTQSLLDAMRSADQSFNYTGLITSIYESERDLTTIGSFVVPGLQLLQSRFLVNLNEKVMPELAKSLSSSERENLANEAPQLFSPPLQFSPVNLSNYHPSILIAPLQVGLIYMIIIAFFQFNFFAVPNQRIGGQLKPMHTLLYRITVSWVSYLFISLILCLVSVAFQIHMDTRFGKSGFLVYWMVSWLTMFAAGQATENMALLIIPIYPPGIGLWLLFWVVSNISPAFSALALTHNFYRYGYAFPILNSLSVLRVVVCGTTKKHIGRNVAVIIIWDIINMVMFPFCLKFFVTRMQAKAKAEAEAKAKSESEKGN